MDAEVTSSEAAAPDQYSKFDFGDAGHVTNEQVRMLRSLDEMLARNLTHGLSAWLRTTVEVIPQPQNQQTYSEFLERTEGCYLMALDVPELHATGLLRWPFPLAAHMIELLLGGSGVEPAESRALTEVEDAVFSAVLDIVLRELNAVWGQIALQFVAGERPRSGSERQLLPPSERIFAFTFEVRTGDIIGKIALCIAAPVLASALRRVSALRRPMGTSAMELGKLLTLIRDARVRTSLCFSPVNVSASKLSTLEPGGTLILPLPSNSTAELRISDVPVATATPVRMGERRAARVTLLHHQSTEQEQATGGYPGNHEWGGASA